MKSKIKALARAAEDISQINLAAMVWLVFQDYYESLSPSRQNEIWATVAKMRSDDE